jgi:hypothetical protein
MSIEQAQTEIRKVVRLVFRGELTESQGETLLVGYTLPQLRGYLLQSIADAGKDYFDADVEELFLPFTREEQLSAGGLRKPEAETPEPTE